MQPFITTRNTSFMRMKRKSNYSSTLGVKQYKPDVLNFMLAKIFFFPPSISSSLSVTLNWLFDRCSIIDTAYLCLSGVFPTQLPAFSVAIATVNINDYSNMPWGFKHILKSSLRKEEKKIYLSLANGNYYMIKIP